MIKEDCGARGRQTGLSLMGALYLRGMVKSMFDATLKTILSRINYLCLFTLAVLVGEDVLAENPKASPPCPAIACITKARESEIREHHSVVCQNLGYVYNRHMPALTAVKRDSERSSFIAYCLGKTERDRGCRRFPYMGALLIALEKAQGLASSLFYGCASELSSSSPGCVRSEYNYFCSNLVDQAGPLFYGKAERGSLTYQQRLDRVLKLMALASQTIQRRCDSLVKEWEEHPACSGMCFIGGKLFKYDETKLEQDASSVYTQGTQAVDSTPPEVPPVHLDDYERLSRLRLSCDSAATKTPTAEATTRVEQTPPSTSSRTSTPKPRGADTPPPTRAPTPPAPPTNTPIPANTKTPVPVTPFATATNIPIAPNTNTPVAAATSTPVTTATTAPSSTQQPIGPLHSASEWRIGDGKAIPATYDDIQKPLAHLFAGNQPGTCGSTDRLAVGASAVRNGLSVELMKPECPVWDARGYISWYKTIVQQMKPLNFLYKVSFPDATTMLESVEADQKGSFLLAGTSQELVSYPILTKMSYTGAVDTSFGVDGRVTLKYGIFSRLSRARWLRDGKIIGVGVQVAEDGVNRVLIFRLNPNGTPDTSFASDGFKTIEIGGYGSSALDVIEAPDGTLYISGQVIRESHSDPFVAHLSPEASVLQQRTLLFNGENGAGRLALQQDGKIVFAVQSRILKSNSQASQLETNAYIQRLNADLSNDSTFNGGLPINMAEQFFSASKIPSFKSNILPKRFSTGGIYEDTKRNILVITFGGKTGAFDAPSAYWPAQLEINMQNMSKKVFIPLGRSQQGIVADFYSLLTPSGGILNFGFVRPINHITNTQCYINFPKTSGFQSCYIES